MVMVCVARWLNISNVIRFFPECFCTMNLFLSAPNRILSLGELNSWMNLFKSIHCQNDDNFFILFRPRFSARISNRNSHNSNDTINGNAWGISHMNEWSFHTRHTPRCFYMSCSFGTWKQTEFRKWISIHALNTQMFDDRLPNCLLVNRRILLKSSTHTLERAHQYMRVCRLTDTMRQWRYDFGHFVSSRSSVRVLSPSALRSIYATIVAQHLSLAYEQASFYQLWLAHDAHISVFSPFRGLRRVWVVCVCGNDFVELNLRTLGL